MNLCSLVECCGMYELFEKDADKVKFTLESPSSFFPYDGALNNLKQCVPMKGISVIDWDARVENTMCFLETLATIRKSPKE